MTFQVTQTITDEQVRSLLCNAFEGGSNYWYSDLEPVFAPGVTKADVREGGRLQPVGASGEKQYWHWAELLPTIEGCGVRLRAKGAGKKKGDVYGLNRDAIQRGIQAMAKQHPRHFANWMSENDDAETGDVFLQMCLFGELIFG